MTMKYKLKRKTKHHESDIKDIIPTVATCSRDGTIKIHNPPHTHTLHHGYVNSLTQSETNIFAGCQDGTIVTLLKNNSVDCCNCSEIKESKIHNNNVVSLDFNGALLSGSWDCTAKISNGSSIELEFNHPQSVWSVKFIDKNRFVTGCADTLIRIFTRSGLEVSFDFHFNCVRSVAVKSTSDEGHSRLGVVSVSNEGLLLSNFVPGLLFNHFDYNTLLFSLYVDDEHIVVCGDNGVIFINGQRLQLDVDSLWKCSYLNRIFYFAGSDGCVYEIVNEADLELLNDENKELADNKDVLNNKESADNKDVLNNSSTTGVNRENGEEQNNDVKRKVVNGKVFELHDGRWVLVGDVVEKFDNTFNVEVEDKTLQIKFNDNENVSEVAERFLKHNKLNPIYKEEIIEFINKNFKKKENIKLMDEINVNGVFKILDKLGEEEIKKLICKIENIQETEMIGEVEMIGEEELQRRLDVLLEKEKEYRFMVVDLFRYFHAKGYNFNLSFLLRFIPKDKKEATVFVKFVSNLYSKRPFNLEKLRRRVRELKDTKLLEDSLFDIYEKNRKIGLKL